MQEITKTTMVYPICGFVCAALIIAVVGFCVV